MYLGHFRCNIPRRGALALEAVSGAKPFEFAPLFPMDRLRYPEIMETRITEMESRKIMETFIDLLR